MWRTGDGEPCPFPLYIKMFIRLSFDPPLLPQQLYAFSTVKKSMHRSRPRLEKDKISIRFTINRTPPPIQLE
jgi:hypothetical protein